jgi:hypothetical protein
LHKSLDKNVILDQHPCIAEKKGTFRRRKKKFVRGYNEYFHEYNGVFPNANESTTRVYEPFTMVKCQVVSSWFSLTTLMR